MAVSSTVYQQGEDLPAKHIQAGARLPPVMRRHPRQSRSRLLVQSVKESCEMLLTRGRADAQLKASDIAEMAGISSGSLYQYFPNKEAIIASLYEDVIREEAALIKRMVECEWSVLSFGTLRHSLQMSIGKLHQRLVDLDAHLSVEFYSRYDLMAWIRRVVGPTEPWLTACLGMAVLASAGDAGDLSAEVPTLPVAATRLTVSELNGNGPPRHLPGQHFG